MQSLKIFYITILCLVLAAWLSACGGGSAISVTQEQNGGSVELKTGGILEVRLESNPSTGYSWQVVGLQGNVLEQQGEAEYKAESALPKPGSGGVEIFRFKALQPGELALRLAYSRPWEKDVEPIETFELLVVVK